MEINKVIITDEDQSYKCVIKKLPHSPTHVLCSIHKIKNFNKHLKNSSLTKQEKTQAKQIFSKICFSKNKITVEKAFQSLFLLKDTALREYCKKLYDEKSYFCKAFLKVFTIGYNTSSLAESTNNLIKLDSKGKYLSLKDFRIAYEKSHKRAASNAAYSNDRKLYPTNFPFVSIIENVSRTCVCELHKNVKKSIKYESIFEHESNSYHVYHRQNKEDIQTVNISEITITCTCNQNIVYGYPCVHIINVILTMKPNVECLSLINEHWILNKELRTKLEINNEAFGLLKETIYSSYDVVEEADIDIDTDTQKRYCKIFYLGKQLARIGYLGTDIMYDNIIVELNRLISIASKPVNIIHEPQMAHPKKKGRIKSQKIVVNAICYICGRSHQIEECSIYNIISGGAKTHLEIRNQKNADCAVHMDTIFKHVI